MDSMTDAVKKSALDFAKAGNLSSARTMITNYKLLRVGKEEVEALKKEVGIAYLKACKEPIHFGVVPDGDYLMGRMAWDSYIGLSPRAKPTYCITEPYYDKVGNNLEVLVQFAKREWVYGMFTQLNPDVFHGGRVISATKGTITVIPFFSTDGIESIARNAIKRLKGADYHEWAVPDDFSLGRADYAHIQEEQTNLALKSVGLPTKY